MPEYAIVYLRRAHALVEFLEPFEYNRVDLHDRPWN